MTLRRTLYTFEPMLDKLCNGHLIWFIKYGANMGYIHNQTIDAVGAVDSNVSFSVTIEWLLI